MNKCVCRNLSLNRLGFFYLKQKPFNYILYRNVLYFDYKIIIFSFALQKQIIMAKENFPESIQMGQLFKKIRKMNNWTQAEMAEMFEVSSGTVLYAERGIVQIPSRWLVILYDKFNVNPMYILGLSKSLYVTKKTVGYKGSDRIPIQASPLTTM